jgi:hypothetical protein
MGLGQRRQNSLEDLGRDAGVRAEVGGQVVVKKRMLKAVSVLMMVLRKKALMRMEG